MKRLVASILVVLCCGSSPALAWDPFGDELDPGVTEPNAPDSAPFVVPAGVYLVTDVYSGDVVTASGGTTTYSTTTVRDTPGTYARVIDTVGTGDGSAFDGSSFNGRARLGDGRPVAGTYYEDFVMTADGFVSVNVVFFQDDSETHALIVPTPVPATFMPMPATPTSARPAATPAIAAATNPPVGRVATPFPTPAPVVATPAPVIATPTPTASAGVALAPLGPALAEIEVIRGRTVHLWPRVFVDGVAAPVRTWHLLPGLVDPVTRADGGATDSCDVTWLTLASAGSVWTVGFDVTTDAAPGRVLRATLKVAVRSPALLQ